MSTKGARVAAGGGSTIAQKAALASAYQELGRELSSGRLKTVGNYTLGRPIGEGTYGKVPRAHQHISSLTREIHHHRRLHHPNVMQLYEVIATEAHIWMAVELCAGGELYDYLVERGVLPETETRRIFGQLCLALAYVHAKGIVHRDLKLENVLLDERCNVKLGDFGFTREYEKNKLMDTFCGTTGYAAPEMLAGKKYTGEQVDIWSLGIVLYALLCGALPFDDDDDDVMKAKILVGQFEIPEEISEEAQDLLKSILRHNPTERPTIRSILSHAWFKKDFAIISMSTVEEAESLHSSVHVEVASAEIGDNETNSTGMSHTATSKPELSTLDVAVRTKISDEPGTASSGSDSYTTPLSTPALESLSSNLSRTPASNEGGAKSLSVNDVSSASFSSGVSDSESSDQRSSTTDVTNPTTEEGSSNASDSAADVTVAKENERADTALTADSVSRIGLHRNESQTTIRRDGSVSSTGSKRVSGGAVGKTNATLATHHESLSSSEVDSISPTSPGMHTLSLPEEKDEDENAVTLNKRNSQGSSKGHHRTPSRTKRRSVSSSGLSIHETPSAQTKPLDYVSLLAHLQPDLFSTALEQRLLSQMSTLGLDVGQIVHSILNDACDTTGATWWLLKRKAEERATFAPRETSLPATPLLERTELDMEQQYADAQAAARALAVTQITVPAKERERGRPAEGLPPPSSYTYTGPTHSTDGLPKTAVDSFRRRVDPTTLGLQDVSTATESSLMSKLIEVERAAENGAAPPTSAAQASLDGSRSSPGGLQQGGRSPDDGPFDSRRPSLPTTDKAEIPKRKEPTRTRTNSFSMRQLTSALVGSSVSGSPSKASIDRTDGAAAEGERAKSPVSALFGKRGGGSVLKGSGRSREGSPLASVDEKSRSGPSKLLHDASGGTLRAPVATYGAPSSPLRNSGAVSSDSPSDLQRRAVSSDTANASRNIASSESVEAFSDVVSDNDGDTPIATVKGRTKSSFLSTVRTWLGTDEKQARKRGKKGKGVGVGKGKLPASSHGHDGPVSASQLHTRQGSTRNRASPYNLSGSVSRRGSHIISLSPTRPSGASRRGSTSSVQLLAMMDGSGSLARPPNIRRQSAGSITPTTTMYGEGEIGMAGLAAFNPRTSRPGSSNSLYRAVRPGSLHAKSGSASSCTSSVFRMQQATVSPQSSGYAGSLRGMHARRPSDGGATVRRHRQYPSAGRRASSIASRNSSPAPPLVDDDEDVTIESLHPEPSVEAGTASPRPLSVGGAHSRRPSLDSQPGTPRASAHSHSIFVAHKSRSPYKPPSANLAHLHHPHPSHSISGALARAASRSPKARTTELPSQSPSADTAVVTSTKRTLTSTSGPVVPTWRRSWGRPPPAWTGAVDDQPSTDELVAAARPKLRDVFAGKDDDEWVDEGDEQPYSGGLGQVSAGASALISLGNATGAGGRGSGFTSVSSRATDGSADSPFATRTMPGLSSGSSMHINNGSYSRYANGGGGSGLLASGRYAGVRTLFTPPSLGRDIAPRMLAVSPAVADASDGISPVLPPSNNPLDPVLESDSVINNGTDAGSVEQNNGATSSSTPTVTSGGTQRSRAQPPAFKNMPIEEEEEDE